MAEEPAFIFGQILDCANALHREYASRAPAKFVGEEYIRVMLSNAQFFMRDRAAFYRRLETFYSWANPDRNESRKARMLYLRIKKLQALINNWLPERLTDRDKCLMGAGYYSKTPKSKSPTKMGWLVWNTPIAKDSEDE